MKADEAESKWAANNDGEWVDETERHRRKREAWD
jgi:hypothetical protein